MKIENKSMCSITVITSLYNSDPFLEGYFKAVSEIQNTHEIEILLVHNAPSAKELAIIEKYLPRFPFITHLQVAEREGLYSSWNRGITHSKGKYIAIWNVDDIRTPDSLELQKNALDSSRAAMCYGDFYGTDNYGSFKEKLYEYKHYRVFKKTALRRHIIGCFPMWRKDIHQSIGYFDEQFRIVGDFEFQIRTALNYDLVKADSILGFYLENKNHKLTSNIKLLDKERTVVELRYRIYDKILLHIIPFISSYKIHHILCFGTWASLDSILSPSHLVDFKSIGMLIAAPFRYSLWVMRKTLKLLYYSFVR
jgi:glycosyltransferase involved in cell wall biosynthesis